MINTTAQNKYFEALNVMAKTEQYNNNIDTLLDEMFAEFDHNIIGLGFDESQELSGIIFDRFVNVKLNRISMDNANKFFKTMKMKISINGLNKYGMEKLPSGLRVYKQQPKNLQETPATINKKIKWKGAPGEFGAIFNLLFENGYIENPIIKKDMVEQLNKIFEIRTEENKIATDKYIYRCFGEKMYKYPAGLLKIPLSINYHKDK